MTALLVLRGYDAEICMRHHRLCYRFCTTAPKLPQPKTAQRRLMGASCSDCYTKQTFLAGQRSPVNPVASEF